MRVLERGVHSLHRRIQRLQLDDAIVALDVHLMVGDDERQQACQRLALIKVGDRIARPVRRTVDGQGANRAFLHAERPAHRRMR